MNGTQTKKEKIVIDTNIIFMAWYNPLGKCAEVIRKAREEKIKLFSPVTVKEEIIRIFKKRNLTQEEIDDFLIDLPLTWIEKEVYDVILDKTKVKHKADKPIEAVALILNCGILSADRHFKNRIDINKLLDELNK